MHCGWSRVAGSYRLWKNRLTSSRGLSFRTCALLSLSWGFVILQLEALEREPTTYPHMGKASGHKHLQKVLGKQQCSPLKQLVWAITYFHPPDKKTASEHLTASFSPSLFSFLQCIKLLGLKMSEILPSPKTEELNTYYSQVWVNEGQMDKWSPILLSSIAGHCVSQYYNHLRGLPL